MGFGKFGAHPRSMNSGLYWVGRHLQSQRRIQAQNSSIDKFNEKWRRLQDIYEKVLDHFVRPLQDKEISRKEFEALNSANEAARALREHVRRNINDCGANDLSKYATQVKKLALTSMRICADLGVYTDIEEVSYSAVTKSIMLNGQQFYYLG
jgi:hypothetical protein